MAVHEKSIEIDAPVHRVFMMWRNWESFPEFVSHIEEVKRLDEDKTHWKAKIKGIEEEWDARTTRFEQDKVIAWESISGLENNGEVRFEPVDGGTKLTVHLEYKPPAGVIGRAAESIYIGKEFDESLEEDLRNFKNRAES